MREQPERRGAPPASRRLPSRDTRTHAIASCCLELGKIDRQGPDAGAFLDRLYINMFSTLRVGRARYRLMLREDGLLFDDGTTWRLAHDRYATSTTTANAAARHAALAVLPGRSCGPSSMCSSFRSPINGHKLIAGPKARELLERLLDRRFHGSDRCRFPNLRFAGT